MTRLGAKREVMGVVVLSLVFCGVCAGAVWCQQAADPSAGTALPLGMPQQMREALQVIIPCPTPNNAVLIDDQQRSSLADLPGRLVVLRGSPYIPATALMQNYRKKDCKVQIEAGPAKPPVRSTQLECSEEKSLSFLASWFGFDLKKTRKCLLEMRATPAASASMSSSDLNIDLIKTDLIETLPLEKRLCLGVILSVTPYEVLGSLGTLESKPATLGVWYLKLGRDWYRKTQDEQRLYYLVAVYVPVITPEEALMSIPSGTSTGTASGLIDDKMLAAWFSENKESVAKFGVVRTIPSVAVATENVAEPTGF